MLVLVALAGHQTSASESSSLNQTSSAAASAVASAVATGDLSSAASELAGDFAVAASNNNNNYNNDHQQQQLHHNHNHQQQQQSLGNKAKKIQIVYIKVPLAKLRPSLSYGGHDNNQNSYGQQANYSAPSGAKIEQQYEQSGKC